MSDSNFRNRKRLKPRKAYPSLGQQARNLAQTAGQIVRNPNLASDELFESRMTLCYSCEYFDTVQVRCRKCGCKLKGKARFEAAHCPLMKW